MSESVWTRAAKLMVKHRSGCCFALAHVEATERDRELFRLWFKPCDAGSYWWPEPWDWHNTGREPRARRIDQERAQTARVIALLLMNYLEVK